MVLGKDITSLSVDMEAEWRVVLLRAVECPWVVIDDTVEDEVLEFLWQTLYPVVKGRRLVAWWESHVGEVAVMKSWSGRSEGRG